MSRKLTFFISFLLILVSVFLTPFSSLIRPIFAQSMSSGIANYIAISGNSVKQGEIVSFSKNSYKLTDQPYDSTAFAVVTQNPSLDIVDLNNNAKKYAVISSGKTYVRVTTINGPIKPGDLITSSTTPGVGMKAIRNGYVVGTALEGYDAQNIHQDGLVLTNLNFGFYADFSNVSYNLLLTIRQDLTNPALNPLGFLRYLLAALIILISFGFGIGYFGRVITTGVEALGRNPLASRVIMASIVINLVIMVTILIVGVVIAYLILVL